MPHIKLDPGRAATVDGPIGLPVSTQADTPGCGTWPGLAYPTTGELERLFAYGVEPDAMTEPWPIRSACVVLDGLHGFEFKRTGEPALIFKAEDRGEELDLIAWQQQTGKLVSWHGCAFCLSDIDDVFNPGTFFAGSALRIHTDPLDWLKAAREGIVILRPDLTYAYLRNALRLSFADVHLAQQVRRWLQPPASRVELLVEVSEQRAAA